MDGNYWMYFKLVMLNVMKYNKCLDFNYGQSATVLTNFSMLST